MTHDVFNQVPLYEGRNLFQTDPFLMRILTQLTGDAFTELLTEFGEKAGRLETFEWGRLANENPPKLKTHDRFGNRINVVEYHPSYHNLMAFSMANGLHTSPWRDDSVPKRLLARCAQNYMMTQVEAGHGCPITMTFAAVPALRQAGGAGEIWIDKLLANTYDPRNVPSSEKSSCTVGMAMTEKQGGSDVRANRTIATMTDENIFTLNGHKWFCSAPMSDIFLTLGKVNDQLTCFVVPRWNESGRPNGMNIQRLKDKVGNRSNASSEIEYHDALAYKIGDIGRGVSTIIEMVTHTRLDCVVASAANLRLAAAHATHHAKHRMAFGSTLYNQPLMRTVLADLHLEAMAGTALAFCIAEMYDTKKQDPSMVEFTRLCTAIGKFWVCKRASMAVTEAMECHGGNGFVHPSLMARLYTEAPLNSIWEGSGNVICLDVLRTLAKAPRLLDVFGTYVQTHGGHDRRISGLLGQTLKNLSEPNPATQARQIVERMALLLQACALTRFSTPEVLECFVQSRMVDRSLTLGGLSASLPIQNLLNEVEVS